MSESEANVVSLDAFRKQERDKGERGEDEGTVSTKALMVSVTLWRVNNPESPIDVSITATEADQRYNFAALFDADPGTPRLLALADGLEALAGKLRSLHNTLASPDEGA